MKFEEVDEIMKGIAAGRYPEDPVIPVVDSFVNDSGQISNLAWGAFASASFITSVAGSVRSNHYHETDFHFIYVVDGLMQYYWRQAGSVATPKRKRCPPGTLIFTPPLVEHATFFPKATSVVTFNRRARDHESHESDLVRIPPIVTSEVCKAVMNGVRCCLPYQHVEARDFREPIHAGDHESADGQAFGF